MKPSRTRETPRPRGSWRSLWDRRRTGGTSGARTGTSGARWLPPLRAVVFVAAFIGVVDVFNVLTELHDAARQGRALALWEPVSWEFTSGVGALVACPIVYAALRRAPPDRGPWVATFAVHAGASLAFSAVHVGLMMALRIGLYGVLGFRYRIEHGAGLYEYRKDLLAYIVLAGVLRLTAAPRAQPARVAPVAPAAPVTFDIVDGARTLRTPVSAILAVRSAANYVEFQLEDGRRPLMRATLRDLQLRLERVGFTRTHRSWLVNGERVESVVPAGSGDHLVRLAGGVEAPLSRRYRAALDRLRGG